MYIYYDKSAAKDKLKTAAALSKMIHTIDVDATPSLSKLSNKMSWRFLPLEDPTVERFIARDCDSRLTPRDKAAVDAWVESGKKFHVVCMCCVDPAHLILGQVRDHPSHSNYPMSGANYPIQPASRAYPCHPFTDLLCAVLAFLALLPCYPCIYLSTA